MLKCKQIIDLASKSLDTSIPWQQRWKLKLHLMMCKTCNRYVKQLRFMQKAILAISEHRPDIILPDDAKKRIKNKINH